MPSAKYYLRSGRNPFMMVYRSISIRVHLNAPYEKYAHPVNEQIRKNPYLQNSETDSFVQIPDSRFQLSLVFVQLQVFIFSKKSTLRNRTPASHIYNTQKDKKKKEDLQFSVFSIKLRTFETLLQSSFYISVKISHKKFSKKPGQNTP